MCELNPDRAKFRLSELSNHIKDISATAQRMKTANLTKDKGEDESENF